MKFVQTHFWKENVRPKFFKCPLISTACVCTVHSLEGKLLVTRLNGYTQLLYCAEPANEQGLTAEPNTLI